jgi:hypothetical protein
MQHIININHKKKYLNGPSTLVYAERSRSTQGDSSRKYSYFAFKSKSD